MSARDDTLIGRPAVFLDRDGVLTEPIWNPATREYESPHTVANLVFCPDVFAPLRALHAHGYDLFIVSNQPSYAKGKTSLENIREIADAVTAQFRTAGIAFRAQYYCYHHPHGIVPEYSGPCDCRKPAPGFLLRAAADYGIDISRSWMIGDRDTDVECGQRAGCRTILIAHPHAGEHQGRSEPTDRARDLAAATARILGE